MHQHWTQDRIPRDNSVQISPQRHGLCVLVVMRYRGLCTKDLFAEIEKGLEVQHTLGRRAFQDMIRMIVREAIEEMKWEDQEEDRELSDELEN